MTLTRTVLLLNLAILFTLFLRDIPFFNVLIIDKLWLAYLLILSVYFFWVVKPKMAYIPITYGTLLFAMCALLIINIPAFYEIVGMVLYFVLWITALLKIFQLFKEKS